MTSFTKNLRLEKPDFNLFGWHDPVNKDFDIIDAAISSISGLTGISGIWSNNVTYVSGDRVIDNTDNTVWQALETHTSAPTGPMSDDRAAHPANWLTISNGFSVRGAWAASTGYAIGDVVYDVSEHVVALCIVNHVSTSGIRVDYGLGKWVWIADLKQDVLDAHSNADDALEYTWSTSTVDAFPGVGLIRVNNASMSAATQMFLSNHDTNTFLVSSIIDLWDDSTNTIKGVLTVRSKTNPTSRHIYQTTGVVVDGDGYRKVTLSYVGGSGTFAAAEQLYVVFNRYGDKGAAGPGSGDVLAANNGSEFVGATFRTNLSLYSKSEVDLKPNTVTAKGTVVDADKFSIADSAASGAWKSVTWSLIKSTMKTYLDAFYSILGAVNTWTARNAFAGNVVANNGISTAVGSLGEIEVRGNGVGAAYMAFLRPGQYGIYLGVDTDNTFRIGGWSMGAASYVIWHSGNDGPGSGLDAGSVAGGWVPQTSNVAFSLVGRDGSGDITARLLRTEFSGGGWNGSYVLALNTNGGANVDNYARPTPATSIVSSGMVGLGFGNVGTYALLRGATVNVSYFATGNVYAGSGLRYAGLNSTVAFTSASTPPVGTWMAMGEAIATSTTTAMTLFMRVS